MIQPFAFSATPQLHFGEGKLSLLKSCIRLYGSHVLLVTGAKSFIRSSRGLSLLQELDDAGIRCDQYSVEREPSPAIVDAAVDAFSSHSPDCVVSIGGGSVLDAGKAISAMLPLREGVRDYLEGVGTKPHPGVKVPFIAVPTTSGTGSEATKNAVLSETGEQGYKKSLRHNNFVPDIAIVDPHLTVDCPQAQTAASGMDAFTQLLESFLSTGANPVTDALAFEGLRRIANSLPTAYREGSNLPARTDLALASYLSGITLANAGLGLVHGFASPLGGFFNIPHGVICAALMGPTNRITVRKLRAENTNPQALAKYSRVGKTFSKDDKKSEEYYVDYLLALIDSWTLELKIPPLATLGVRPQDFERVVAGTDNKNNPVALQKEEMIEILTKV